MTASFRGRPSTPSSSTTSCFTAIIAGTDYNAGIWPWSADDSVFQLNEAAFTQNTKDGEGFDSDFNTQNSLFEYNYSHDNQGGFMLICTPATRNKQPHTIGNTGTVIRWNVSQNDRSRIFNLSGAEKVTVEGNLIFVPKDDQVQLLLVSSWDGWSDDAAFRSNRFYVDGSASYGHATARHADGVYELAPGWGDATNIRFEANTYSGNQIDPPPDFKAKGTAPPAVATGFKDEPTFDPGHPDKFPPFIRAHRTWMVQMLQRELGQPVKLEAVDTAIR